MIDIKTVKAWLSLVKLGFNQVDPITYKQESIGLRVKKLFWGWRNNWRFFCSKLFDWLLFSEIKTCVEIDKLGHAEIAKYLDCKFIRTNPDKKYFSAYDDLGKICKYVKYVNILMSLKKDT